jgi:hypothetical protein
LKLEIDFFSHSSKNSGEWAGKAILKKDSQFKAADLSTAEVAMIASQLLWQKAILSESSGNRNPEKDRPVQS